jgi:hypothetical protein
MLRARTWISASGQVPRSQCKTVTMYCHLLRGTSSNTGVYIVLHVPPVSHTCSPMSRVVRADPWIWHLWTALDRSGLFSLPPPSLPPPALLPPPLLHSPSISILCRCRITILRFFDFSASTSCRILLRDSSRHFQLATLPICLTWGRDKGEKFETSILVEG